MAFIETASTITGDVASTAAVTRTYKTTIGVVELDGVLTLEHWMTQDDAAVRQVQTLTIDSTPPAADAYYIVTGADGATYVHFYDQSGGDTADVIATKLGKILEQEPNTAVSVAASVITLTTLAAGATSNVTAEVRNAADNSVVAGKVTVAETVAASGTSSKRLLSRIGFTDTLVSETVVLNLATTFYNGDDPATVRSTSGQTLTHPRNITQLASA